MKRWLAAVGIALILTTVGSQLHAQQISLGVKAGMNYATVTGDDAEDAKYTPRMIAGGFLVAQFNDNVAFMPEILYSQKGAKWSGSGDVDGLSGKFKVDYIEVPLLVRLSPTMELKKVLPYALLGGSVAYQAKCRVEGKMDNLTLDTDCDNPDLDLSIRNVDYGLIAGLGADIMMGRTALVIDGRYSYGLPKLDKSDDESDIHNSVFALMVGIRVSTGPAELAFTR